MHKVPARARQGVDAYAVVHQPADEEPALVLSHRGDRCMVFRILIPQTIQNLTFKINLDHPTDIDIGKQPLVRWQLAGHAVAEAGHAHGQIKRRRPHTCHGDPEITVRGPVDIVRQPRQVND